MKFRNTDTWEAAQKAEIARRNQFFANLLSALRPSSNGKEVTHGIFAASEAIKPSQGFSLKSIYVEGAGRLHLPLSIEDTSKLRDVCEQRMFGKGSTAMTDPTVRHSWQVDASKVSFPGKPTFLSETIQTLAMESVHWVLMEQG